MRGFKHNSDETPTLLGLVLQLHGEFRRSLEPIRITPLQAGVLLFLCRRADASLTDATAALRVTVPTLSEVVKDLVGKRWVIKRRSVTDARAVTLSLSRRGLVMTRKIEQRVRQMNITLAEQDRQTLGLTSQGRRT